MYLKSLWLFLGLLVVSPFAAGVDIDGPSPWPEIRKQRIAMLLPRAMEAAGVDAWLTLCRENNNDPLADHIGGENAGRLRRPAGDISTARLLCSVAGTQRSRPSPGSTASGAIAYTDHGDR